MKRKVLNLSREPTFKTLMELQEPKHSYTVVVRPKGYTTHGLDLLYKVAKGSSRHRFVLVVEAKSFCRGVPEQCDRLQKTRNVFIGYVGVDNRKPSFETVGGAYAELIKRATPSSAMAS